MAPPAPAHSTWIGRCMPTRIFAHEAHGADGARTGRFQRKRPYFFHSRTRIGCADEAQKSAGACVHCGRRWPTPGVWPKNGPRGGIAHAHALCMRAGPAQNAHVAGPLGTSPRPLSRPTGPCVACHMRHATCDIRGKSPGAVVSNDTGNRLERPAEGFP